MRHAVITTTIHVPDNLESWARSMKPKDVIVVAGDQKTPHAEVVAVLTEVGQKYGLFTEYVPGHGKWTVGPVIGWNSIQRRNIATLTAMTYRPDFITTIDTDNYPLERDQIKRIQTLLTEVKKHDVVSADRGWLNVGEFLAPPVIHRGYPLSMRRMISDREWNRVALKIGVHASLWEGDPDIDAIERIHADPETHIVGETPFLLANNTWCPFNSQATTYRRELFPLMFVWPFVGRMDDIWPSYVARHIMNHFGWHTMYGAPNVRQERNPHNLVKDLEDEIIGYRHTDRFVEMLKQIDLSECVNVVDALGKCTAAIARWPFMPPPLSLFFDKWHRDLNTLQSRYDVSFE